MHQLETLLEATVDKAFDKFEIYVLRNILTVPEDLLGWIRLKHYEVGFSFHFGIAQGYSMPRRDYLGMEANNFLSIHRISPSTLQICQHRKQSKRGARS